MTDFNRTGVFYFLIESTVFTLKRVSEKLYPNNTLID